MRDDEDKPRNLGDAIAYRIRAELVCCDVYGKVNDDPSLSTGERNNLRGRLVLNRDWHDLCYWGEASSRLAEIVGQIHEEARQRQRDARVRLVIDTLVKAMIFGQKPGELYPTIDAALAEVIIDILDDHDRRLQAVTEHTHLTEDLERGTKTKTGVGTKAETKAGGDGVIELSNEDINSLDRIVFGLNEDPGWGREPSFRCWTYRHDRCESFDTEAGCTCECHVSEGEGKP